MCVCVPYGFSVTQVHDFLKTIFPKISGSYQLRVHLKTFSDFLMCMSNNLI